MSGIPEDELFRTTEGEPYRPENGQAQIPEDPRETMPAQRWAGEALPREESSINPEPMVPVAAESSVWVATEAEVPQPVRIPHLGHMALLLLVLVAGFALAILLILIALHFHVYGVSSIEQTKSEIHYQLGSEGLGYLFTLLGCVVVFPMVWNKGFFAGVQWNAATALRLRWWLVGAAFVCFLLALLNSVVLPGPKHTPIEDIFREPGAAWLLFGFGITFAPFFEELFFRGFLLPAFCTAFDWVAARVDKQREGPLRVEGRPRWASGANLVAAAATAVPFAAACTLASKRYLLIGILLFFAWCCTAALVWTIWRRSTPAVSYQVVDEHGHPVWSFPAMACVALFTSVPFALMHAPQTGFSVGPFLLLVGVSVVLCSVRLWTRSLAASTLVHASYNFMLFAIMMVGTQGFRHMDKM